MLAAGLMPVDCFLKAAKKSTESEGPINSGEPSEKMYSTQARAAIARNTFWNMLGVGLPVLITLVTVPVLIRGIGVDRFGVLIIAWVVLSYFGLFDLGLGRATIRFLAEAFEHRRVAEVRALFWTSLFLNGVLGVLGGAILAMLTPVLVNATLNIPGDLRGESAQAFYLTAASVPLVTVTTAVRGTLEAQHRFGLVNALQIPVSAFTQIAPLLVLPFSNNLVWLVGAVVFVRVLGALVFLAGALRSLDAPLSGPFFMRESLANLFSYGGWLTVTNIIGPLMVYADRFFIGSVASMSAVTYYATPYEAVTRLWMLPQSLMRTVFPIFSAGIDAQKRTAIYVNAIKHLTLSLTPIVVVTVIFASDLLRLWVGEDFAKNSTLVLQILAVGVLINSLAQVPYTLVQGMGRPDITAKFHLLELPFYLILLWYGVHYWGIVGAAAAWTVRVSIDGLLLAIYVRANRNVRPSPTKIRLYESLASSALLVAGGWLLAGVTDSLFLKTAISVAVLAPVGYGVWKKLLTREEREKAIGFVRGMWIRSTGKHPRPRKGRGT